MLCHVQVAAQPSLGRGHACSLFHQFPILSGCVASGNYSRKPSRQSRRPHRTSSVSTSWSMEVSCASRGTAQFGPWPCLQRV